MDYNEQKILEYENKINQAMRKAKEITDSLPLAVPSMEKDNIYNDIVDLYFKGKHLTRICPTCINIAIDIVNYTLETNHKELTIKEFTDKMEEVFCYLENEEKKSEEKNA